MLNFSNNCNWSQFGWKMEIFTYVAMFNRPGVAGAVLKLSHLSLSSKLSVEGLFPNTVGILSWVYFSPPCGIFHTHVGFSTLVLDFPHTWGIFHMFVDRTYHVEKITQVGHLPHLSCLFQIHSAFLYTVNYFWYLTKISAGIGYDLSTEWMSSISTLNEVKTKKNSSCMWEYPHKWKLKLFFYWRKREIFNYDTLTKVICPIFFPPENYNTSFCFIMVQLTVHVSVSGLPVLTILYRLILMHKRTKSQNCDFCVS